MGIGVISNRYLDFEKIKFLITCFEKFKTIECSFAIIIVN
nr:MAG TPA: hypothetical protein [Bacteriophage sp.]